MFPLKTVQCVGVYYILVILWQTCYAVDYTNIKNVYSDLVDENEQHTLELPELVVAKEWEDEHVEFITKNTLEDTQEDRDFESNFNGNWILKSWNNKEKVQKNNQYTIQKRVARQSNTGYSPLYPTLPAKGSYGNYGPYNFNNVTNPQGQSLTHGLNITNPSPYNYSNFSGFSNSNFTSRGPNLYQYNPQYPTQSGMNSYHAQNNSTFITPSPTNGIHGRPTNSYNNSGNSYFPQPTNGSFYPRAPNNRTNLVNPQSTSRPLYPGTINDGNTVSYPQPPNRSFYPVATNNRTFPGYPQPTGTQFYPGAINNYKNTSYPQSTSRPFHPGPTNNNRTSQNYPAPGNRLFYPGVYINGTQPSYSQQGNRPMYPSSRNREMYPGYPTFPNQMNSTPSFNNAYNSSKRPTYNVPSPSSYNPRSGLYNPNGSPQGQVIEPQRPVYNNSGHFNTGIRESQGHINTSNPFNSNWKNPQYRTYNHTNIYSASSDSQYYGNVPTNPNFQNSNSYSDKPSQYNLGSEYKNFFYHPPTSGPIYDPRKNSPNQFS